MISNFDEKEYRKQYNKSKYRDLSLKISPEEADKITAAAARYGLSKARLIAAAVKCYEHIRSQPETVAAADGTITAYPKQAAAERRPEAATQPAGSTERRAAVTISAPAEEIAAEDIAPTVSQRRPAQTVTAEDIAAALLKLSDNRAAYLRPHRIRRRRISARRRSEGKTGIVSAAAAPADD